MSRNKKCNEFLKKAIANMKIFIRIINQVKEIQKMSESLINVCTSTLKKAISKLKKAIEIHKRVNKLALWTNKETRDTWHTASFVKYFEDFGDALTANYPAIAKTRAII